MNWYGVNKNNLCDSSRGDPVRLTGRTNLGTNYVFFPVYFYIFFYGYST